MSREMMTFEESFEAVLNDALLLQKSTKSWAIFDNEAGQESSRSDAEIYETVENRPDLKRNFEGAYEAFEVARETEKFIRTTFPRTVPGLNLKMPEPTEAKRKEKMLKSKPGDNELNLL